MKYIGIKISRENRPIKIVPSQKPPKSRTKIDTSDLWTIKTNRYVLKSSNGKTKLTRNTEIYLYL